MKEQKFIILCSQCIIFLFIVHVFNVLRNSYLPLDYRDFFYAFSWNICSFAFMMVNFELIFTSVRWELRFIFFHMKIYQHHVLKRLSFFFFPLNYLSILKKKKKISRTCMCRAVSGCYIQVDWSLLFLTLTQCPEYCSFKGHLEIWYLSHLTLFFLKTYLTNSQSSVFHVSFRIFLSIHIKTFVLILIWMHYIRT